MVASSISDLSKFYERIEHEMLLFGCRGLMDSEFCSSFPLGLALLCVLMYGSKRHLVVEGSVSIGVVTF